MSKTKTKEPVITQSIIGFVLDLGYILSSVVFWALIYSNKVLGWRDAWGYAISLFVFSAAVFVAGLVMSAIGISVADGRENKRSKKYSILGLVLLCLGFAANIVVLIAVWKINTGNF